MFRHLANIFSIPDLRKKVLFTLFVILIHRIGAHIPVPFVDSEAVRAQFDAMARGGGIMNTINMFTGGAFSQMTIFALGIMPYISASIIIQLLQIVIPRLQKIAREGEIGRKKINQYTRYGTVGLALVQSLGVAMFLTGSDLTLIPNHPVGFTLLAMLSVTTGTCFIMWLGEKITEKGVGNGISIMITLGILVSYPQAIFNSFGMMRTGVMSPLVFLLVLAMFAVMSTIIVIFQTATRKIPVQHARRQVGRKMTQAQTQSLPLKINTAGVIPVIFASAILQFFPLVFGSLTSGSPFFQMVGNWFAFESNANPYVWLGIGENPYLRQATVLYVLKSFNLYLLVYVALTAFFCYFYTAITFNPIDLAENLKRSGAFVPGRRPGKATSDYIEYVLVRITLVGAFYLCAVSVLPMIAVISYDMQPFLMDFVGGTGLIIVVGVLLDTMKQIESQMMVRHYEGFKIRRRGAGS